MTVAGKQRLGEQGRLLLRGQRVSSPLTPEAHSGHTTESEHPHRGRFSGVEGSRRRFAIPRQLALPDQRLVVVKLRDEEPTGFAALGEDRNL